MKMTRRLTALLLAFLMVVTCFPSTALSAFAAETSKSDHAVVEEVKNEPTEEAPASELPEEAEPEEEPIPEKQPSDDEEVKPEKQEEAKSESSTDSEPAPEKQPEVKPEEGKTEDKQEEQLPEEVKPEIKPEAEKPQAAITPAVNAVKPAFGGLKADPAPTVLLTVYYIYEDGSPADEMKRLETKPSIQLTVPVEEIKGFDATYDGKVVTTSFPITITADTTIKVIYKAKEMDYKVIHSIEKVDGTFDESNTETLSGIVGEMTKAQALSGYETNWTVTVPAARQIVDGMSPITIKYTRNKCYLNFESNGGSYVSNKSAKLGGTVTIDAKDVSTRKGYTFDGWYLDKDLTQKAGTSISLADGDVTVYAKWIPGNANYTVVYLLENANDDGYTVKESASKSGSVGALATYDTKTYTNFTLDATKTGNEKVYITADGLAVKNVYYSRARYTLKFTTTNGVQVGNTYTFKYEQSTAAAPQWTDWSYQWNADEGGGYYSEAITMPAKNLTIKGSKVSANVQYTTHYYEIQGNTTTEIKVHDDFVQYLEDSHVYKATSSDYIKIPGFTFSKAKSTTPDSIAKVTKPKAVADYDYVWTFYYKRNSYTLTLKQGGQYGATTIKTTNNVPYDAALSTYNITPTAPSGSNYLVFDGWYTDPTCVPSTKVDMTTAKMPANDYILYAGWKLATFKVSYDLNYKIDTKDEHSENVTAGESVAEVPINPTHDGYIFEGWYKDSDLSSEFDLNTEIYANTVIYPKWKVDTNTKYTIRYRLAKDTSVVIFPDETYSGIVGEEATALAKQDNSSTGYIVDRSSDKITLKTDKSQNVITFLYTSPEDVTLHYRVEYRYYENKDKIVQVGGKDCVYYKTTVKNTIVEDANESDIPKGYTVMSPYIQKKLVLETSKEDIKENVIVFYVKPIDYKITYDLQGGTVSGTNPTTYNAETPDFTLINPTKTNYVFKGWTGTDLSSATKTVTVKKGSTGDRQYVADWEGAPVTYVVHYYLDGTTTKVAEDKTDGTGKYGENATENAISIDGYTVDKDSKSITLAASGNEIIFYYTERDDIEYTVNYYLNGTTLKVQDSTTGNDATYNKKFTLSEIPTITGYTTVTTADEAVIDTVKLTGNVINLYYKKNLTITANNVEETYTGSPIGGDGAKVADAPNGLFKGDTFESCTVSGQQTDAGTYADELVPSAAVIKRGGTALTDNEIAAQYVITYEKGDLKITAINGVTVTITGHTAEVYYNGKTQEVTGYDYKVDDANAKVYTDKDFECTGTAKASGIKAGEYTMGLTEDDFANTSNNFTNVTFDVADGKLTIKPKQKDDDTDGDGDVDGDDDPTKPNTGNEYQLSTESDNKVYDGKALTNSNYKLQGVLADGDTIEVVVNGTQTEVGSSENTATYKVLNKNKEDVTFCYLFLDSAFGTLKVTPNTGVTVTITGKKETVTYDGTEHKAEGYDVDINDPQKAYTENDFTFGKTSAEAKGTYAGKYDMGLSDSDFTNTNTNFEDVTFIVNDGSLTITPKSKDDDTDGDGDVDGDDDPTKPNTGKEYKLTAGSNSKVYDGKALTEHSYTLQGVLVKGDKIVENEIVYDGSQTEVGTSDNEITSFKIINASGVDVTKCYTFLESGKGKLKVTPNEEVIVYITGKTDTVTYDGKQHTVTGYEVSISDASGTYTENDIDFTGSATASGIKADTYPMNLSASDFSNNNKNFDNVTFKITDGKLVIEPKTRDDDTNKDGEVTDDEEGSNNGNLYQLTAKSDNKVYDGKPLTLNDYEMKGVLVDGDKITVTVEGSQTEVGESANKVKSFKIVNANNEDVTDCYVFQENIDGKLTVTPLDTVVVKIIGHNKTVVYNGKEQSVTGYDVDLGDYEKLYSTSDIKFDGVAEAKGTLASDTPYPMNLSASDFSNTNKNFKDVVFLITDGYLTINPKQRDGDTDGDDDVDEDDDPTDPTGGKEYQLTADSDEKVYDGKPLTKHSYTKQGVLIEGDKIDEASIVYEGSQTEVGSSANKIKSFKIVNAKGEDVTACYIFKDSIDGTLKVTPLTNVKVTITGHKDTVTYDGKPHEVTGYDVSITDATGTYTEADIDFTGSATASGTKADTYPMNLSDSDFSNNNDNFSNVTFEVIDGSLTIKPRERDDDPTDPSGGKEYQLTADSDEKMYDGTPLTKHSFTAQGVLVAGDKVDESSVVYEGSQTEAGSSPNKIKSFRIINGAGEDVTSCYTFKPNGEGILKVTSNTDIVVTIVGHKDTVTYDGKKHTVTGYDVSMSDTIYTVNDFVFSGTDTVTEKFAGEYPMGLAEANFKNTNPNFANVIFKVTDGGLTIDPRKKDGDKDGDGDIDEDDEKIDGDGASKEYQLTADSDEKPYDGTPLTKDSYTKQGVLVPGDTVSAVVEGSQTDIGSSPNKVKSYKITNNEGEDVTFCYVFKDSIDGLLKVTSYDTAVVIETATDSKIFDGTALKAPEFTLKEGVLAPGDTFVPVYGSGRTNVGSTENTASYVIKNKEGFDVTKKYTNLTISFGILTVEPADLTVTLSSAQKVYDGTPLSSTDFEASPSDLVAGYGLIVEINDTLTDVGEMTISDYIVKVTAPKLLRATAPLFSINNAAKPVAPMPLLGAPANPDLPTPNNYNLNIIPGTLKVTPLEIEITAGSDEKYYDGTALVCDTWSQTDGELAKGQTIDSVKVTGSQTEVGKSANVASDAVILDANGANVSKNYKITYVDGLLTVKQQLKITITAGSDIKTYDGKPLVCDKWEMTDGVLSDGDYIESVTVTGSQTEPGVAKNVASNAVIRNAQGDDVTAKYEIIYIDGILTVTASPKTGDTNNYALLMTIMISSWFAMALLWRTRKKDENEV